MLSELKPTLDPNSNSVVSRRSATQQSIKNAFQEIETASGLSSLPVSMHDVCYSGQHSWKTQDEYAHRCEYRVTKYYGFNNDFKQYMLGFDTKVRSKLWTPAEGGPTMQSMMSSYYDVYYGPDKPKTLAFGDDFSVSSLPEPGYRNNTQDMELKFADKKTKFIDILDYFQNISSPYPDIYEKKSLQDINAGFSALTQNSQFIVAIAIQQSYFQN